MVGLKLRFIFNPRAGRGPGRPRLLARIHSFIAQHHLSATVVPTERPRHATELARRAVDDGCELVVAVGGDGMINEVAQALVGTDAVLGLIPCGSGNGLSRHLGLSRPDDRAFHTLLAGRKRTIDSGTANGIPFFNIVGAGFDAEISRQFNLVTSRGVAAYFRIGVRTWLRFRPETFVISDGQTTVTMRAALVAVANSDQYGNAAFIATGAQVDDGRLDLIAVPPSGFFRAGSLLVRLFLNSFDRGPGVVHLRGGRFTIRRTAPGCIHTDGEVHETGADIEVTIRPRSLHVMVPA
jgi:YegS/Rv2252/BmrU family lipid kinase